MSARFAELMAMSAAQTRDSVAATQQILEEKKRKEEQRKKEQLERERKDREIQARQVKKRLEEEKLAEERKRKQEEERRRKEELLKQKEEEKRRHIVYGNDRKSGGSSGGGGRGRKSQNDSDDDDEVGGLALTREEKRQRRLLADLNKSFTSARKGHSSPASQGLRKPNRAFTSLDLAEASPSRSADQRNAHAGPSNAADSMLTVRKQLASSSTTLMKLGTTKRDLRTIDEIVTDIHKKKEGKVIEGEMARKNGFDWFGEQKHLKSKPASLPSLSPPPEPRASRSPRARSKERVLPPKSSSSVLPRSTASSQVPERKEPRAKVTMIKPEPASLSFSKVGKATSASTKSLVSSKSVGALRSAASNEKSTVSSSKKRSRSESLSDSDVSMDDCPPMPSKRRPVASSAKNDISSEIWKLFGKDRSRYMQNDVFSDDDDDMEADADALRREELRSEKIAKKEDELALEEERRHEEEKRRKKKEKERRGY